MKSMLIILILLILAATTGVLIGYNAPMVGYGDITADNEIIELNHAD